MDKMFTTSQIFYPTMTTTRNKIIVYCHGGDTIQFASFEVYKKKLGTLACHVYVK